MPTTRRSASLVAVLGCGALLLAALAPASKSGWPPVGPLAVADRAMTLSEPGARPLSVHVWYPVAARAETSIPVLLFSPGLGQSPLSYASLLADVASHRFVVVAVNLRYAEPFDFVNEVESFGADLVSTLDRLTHQRSALGEPFVRADLSRVGVFGHSFGVAVAAEACVRDRRVVAGLDLDGSLFGRAVTQGTPCPFLMLFAPLPWNPFDRGPPRFHPDRDQARLHEDSLFAHTRAAYWLTVRGLDHMSFTDGALSPSPSERLAQRLGVHRSAAEVHEVTSRYARAFFGRYVAGVETDSSILSRAPYPFVTLRVHRP
jgi:pimeloyl-ACP methyl ester carboxylesterase